MYKYTKQTFNLLINISNHILLDSHVPAKQLPLRLMGIIKDGCKASQIASCNLEKVPAIFVSYINQMVPE